MIKLFVSDIDGTLLNEKHVISKVTQEAIYDLMDSGVRLVLSSGRNYLGILEALKGMDINISCSALNGGQFVNEKKERIINTPINETIVDKVYDIIQTSDATLEYYCIDEDYTMLDLDEMDEVYTENFKCMCQISYEEAALFVKELNMSSVMKSEKDFNKIKEHQLIKIEFHFRNQKEKERVEKQLLEIKGIHVTSSAPFNIEVTDENATKGKMVQSICEYYGIKEDEVVVIGDSMNDSSMFALFEQSYAMENAEDRVKKLANNIAPSNIDDGCAQIMRMVIEKNAKEI